MGKNKNRLNKFVKSSEPLLNDLVAHGRTFSGNYQGENIKRLKLTDCIFDGAILNDVAATGSNFCRCKFEDCDMDQGDFEYCDFFKCDIKAKTRISIAFDNSNFIETKIHDLKFYSSTFSNSFFDETEFINVEINDCTLEAATFQRCYFKSIDFSNLNLDFVDFRTPHFDKSILPMSQITYTYGLLQYLMTTDDNVYITEKGKKIDSKKYIGEVLPALLEFYLNMNEEEKAKIYFPLINILLVLDNVDEANKYLEKALNLSASIQDFRMLKHYCKLINLSEKYTTRHKKSVYQRICSFFRPSTMTSWQLKDYSRNIGDMKYILLIENNLPTLVFNILTDIYHTGMEKIGIIISDILGLSDQYDSTPQRDIRIEISRNSPIMISVQFTESIENVFYLLKDLIKLTCYTVSKDRLSLKSDTPIIGHFPAEYTTGDYEIKEKLMKYEQVQLSLALLNFHIENWTKEYGSNYPAIIN
ncbi:hypothetical protein C819_04048 [Lachnospiraceae bacterium 10-1]|nr:hypothetical protein C819_04048 [Lachnospiraceae bacterium 10-1]